MKMMRLALLFLVAAALVSAGSPTVSKEFRLTLREAVVIGTQQLQAGDYRLKLDDAASKVTLRDSRSGESFDLNAKIQNGDRKFDQTQVHTDSASGQRLVKEINLGGTKTTVSFP
jgi:hypothetical protein